MDRDRRPVGRGDAGRARRARPAAARAPDAPGAPGVPRDEALADPGFPLRQLRAASEVTEGTQAPSRTTRVRVCGSGVRETCSGSVCCTAMPGTRSIPACWYTARTKAEQNVESLSRPLSIVFRIIAQ